MVEPPSRGRPPGVEGWTDACLIDDLVDGSLQTQTDGQIVDLVDLADGDLHTQNAGQMIRQMDLLVKADLQMNMTDQAAHLLRLPVSFAKEKHSKSTKAFPYKSTHY